MTVKLLLIRHGKTQASVDQLYCGSTDLSLCEEGIRQIKGFIAQNLYDKDIQAFYTSGMKRAVETLKLIFGDVAYKNVPNLAEMHFGEFEMEKHEKLLENENYIKWIEDKTGEFVCPGGESTNCFYQRVDNGFNELFCDIEEKSLTSVALTAHGGTLSRFASKYLDNSFNIYEAMPAQGRGYEIKAQITNGTIIVDEWKKI